MSAAVISHGALVSRAAVLASALLFTACGPEAGSTEDPSRGPATARNGGNTGSGAGTGGNSGGQPGTSGGVGAGAGGASTLGGAGGVSGGMAGMTGGGAGAGGAPAAGPVIPLPVIVTKTFDNQGWFADPELEKKFTAGSTIIRHGAATTGPCAMRTMPTRGDCLKVTYTPPAGLVPPAEGGWVGVFLLPTLLDPAVIGQPNWGVTGEPGKNIAPGATKISFLAAAETEGQQVVFKAGTKSDLFVIPDQKETLGVAWKPLTITLAGATYGSNVYGGFAWVLTDTTKPATFYIDGIVWE